MTLASRALPTLEGAWSELAQQVLAPLRRVPADLYLVYNVVSVGEGLVVDGGAGGDGVVAPWFNSVIGQRFENMWHPSRDPRHIGKDEINRFAAGFDVWTIPEEERLKLGSYRMYHAVGLRWTRRMLVFEDDLFTGHISLGRCQDRPDFSDQDMAVLARTEANARRLVSAWYQLRPGHAIGDGGAYVLSDVGGRIVGATGGAAAWLDAGGRDAIARASRGLEGCDATVTVVHRGVVARVVRTVGDGGTRYVWVLDAPGGLRLDPLAVLSPRQREIARGVAAGLSNREIADRLTVGDETVKTHLSRIYAALGVANRLELAARLAG